jgi:hypothetical protein
VFNNIASTVLNALVGGVIAIIITLFFCIATLLKVTIDPTAFGMLLTFAAAYSGLAVKQFQVKRETELVTDDEVLARDAGDVHTRKIEPPTRVRDLMNARRPTIPAKRSPYDVGVRAPARVPQMQPALPATVGAVKTRDRVANEEDKEGF